MVEYPYTPYALIAVTSLLLLIPAVVYLVWLRPKITATYYLIAFFLCIATTLIAMYLHNAVFVTVEVLWPLQDAMIVVGSLFMACFAYSFPTVERSREAQRMIWLVGLLSAITLAWLLVITGRFVWGDGSWHVEDLYGLLMPAAVVLSVALFLRRMMHFANHPAYAAEQAGQHQFWSVLRKPPNRYALAHRDFALAILSGMIQAFGSVGSLLLPASLLPYFPTETLIAGGTLLTIALLMLAYLNATSAENTLVVRMVGASLILVLTIMGAISIQVLKTAHATAIAAQLELNDSLYQMVRSGEPFDFPDTVAYIAEYPLAASFDVNDISFSYQNSAEQALELGWLAARIAETGVEDWALSADSQSRVITRHRNASLLDTTRYDGFLLFVGDRVVELGVTNTVRNAASHQLVSRLIGQIIIGATLVMIVLPVFFNATLLEPLKNLLVGMRRVNAGDLQTSVPIRIDDEIGFLTRTFNMMTSQLHQSTEGLERTVQTRTAALRSEVATRERVQVELEAAKEAAETANRAKSVFLANMSHELRTPLNAVLGYAQLQQQRTVSNPKQITSIIERSGRHLLTLIDDILDMARIESGKVELHRQSVVLLPFLQEIVELARPSATAKELALQLDAELAPISVAIDPTRMRQILLNLLGNAIKFTDRGAVTLRVTMNGATEQQQRFTFQVIDSGIGIEAAELANIFTPLYQTTSGRRHSAGSGLGLAISHDLVRLMGGALQVTSAVGVGSTFSFTLDLEVVERAVIVAPTKHFTRLQPTLRPHIYLIDDNPDNLELLTTLLTPLGFAVTAFASAQSALRAIEQHAPDAVISDLVMPDIDGYQLVAAIRERGDLTPILVTSASAFPAEAERSLMMGADRFIPKPIDLNALLAALDELLVLAWEPAQVSTAIEVEQALPETELLGQLHQSALEGDIGALRQFVKQLEHQPQYNSFLTQMRLFLGNFQFSELVDWLAPHVAVAK